MEGWTHHISCEWWQNKVCQGARRHSVPSKSLGKCLKRRVIHSTKSGPTTTLTPVEESSLQYIVCVLLGVSNDQGEKNSSVCLGNCKKKWAQYILLKEKGPSEKWWKSLKRRHTQPGKGTNGRPTNHIAWWNPWKLKLKDKPERIYNCDESGICIVPHSAGKKAQM